MTNGVQLKSNSTVTDSFILNKIKQCQENDTILLDSELKKYVDTIQVYKKEVNAVYIYQLENEVFSQETFVCYTLPSYQLKDTWEK